MLELDETSSPGNQEEGGDRPSGQVADPEKQGPRDGKGRFKKGHSGNPEGRPRGEVLSERLRREMAEPASKYKFTADEAKALGLDLATATIGDVLVAKKLQGALGGDARLIEQAFNRTDGKVPDRHELTGETGGVAFVFSTVTNRDEVPESEDD